VNAPDAQRATPPLARTSREALLFFDLTPCPCGEARFGDSSALIQLDDGGLARRYSGACPRCATPREYLFRLPDDVLPDQGEIRFGGDEPSQIIDAGQWLWVADRYARSVPADGHTRPRPDRDRARTHLGTAAAAVDEVLKFLLPGADRVPLEALWTALGRSVYGEEPGRFRVGRLGAVRDSYRSSLRRYA
jgi:hypothetical protein